MSSNPAQAQEPTVIVGVGVGRSASPARSALSSSTTRSSSRHSRHTFSTTATATTALGANGNPNSNGNRNSLLLGDVSFTSETSATPSASASAAATTPNEPIAQQLGRAKAHSLVLKKALLQERQRVSDLAQQLQAKDAVIRAHTQKLDSMAFHNSTLSRRIEQLQSEIRSGGGSPSSATNPTSARARSPALGLISGLFRPGSRAAAAATSAFSSSSTAQQAPSSLPLPTGSASALAQELAATRQLLETTAQELERRIAENEHLQSELADAKTITLSAQSDALAQRDLALQDLERVKAQLDLLQVQVRERDRLEIELARGVEMVARLQAEVQQREQGLQAVKEDKASMVERVDTTLSAFMSSVYFTTATSPATLADIHAAIIRIAHASFKTYAQIVRQLLPLVKEKKRPVLMDLNQSLAACPPCLLSTKPLSILPHRDFLVSFFDAYHSLLQEDGTDTSAIAHVKHQVVSVEPASTSRWDPEPTRAFLRHSSAHVQVLASTHRPIRGLCSELVVKLAEVGKWIDVYEKLASHKTTLDTLHSPMDWLQHVLDLVAAVGEFQVHSLNLATQPTPTSHASTHVQPIDLIPVSTTAAQTTTATLTDGSTQVDLTTNSQSTQTQSRSSLLSAGDSVLRRHSILHPPAAATSISDDDESEGVQCDMVDIGDPHARDLAALQSHFDTRLHAALAAAESASARANHLDLTLSLRVSEFESQLAAECERVREAQAEAERAKEEVEKMKEQMQEAKDKAKDVEESYAAQLQVVMEEVCRLQEEVARATGGGEEK